jgi:signal transduction histidine kinase
VIDKAVSLTANLVNKSTKAFLLHCDTALPTFIGNAQRIEQVVINLVVNACQALPDKDRTIIVATACDTQSQHVVLTVKDEGEGIDEQALKQIIDPFFTTRRESGGTGLGLAISDRIVRDHGGQIQFESQPGEGTTVRVAFPYEEKTST